MTRGEGPGAIEPSATAARLIGLLRPLTPFAEAIVRRQAERAGIAVADLGPEHVATVAPMVLSAAQMFVDPVRLDLLRCQITGG
jgi:hypothetical protein